MPEQRPPIPTEVQRTVLTEAGHRCAVCGEPCPLERAHIIPWRDSQSHHADNLICLCANCHQRADSEHWGQKTLKVYKERPWVVRRECPSDQPIARQLVTLRLPVPFQNFDEKHRRLFIHSLSGFLGEPPGSIEIIEVEPGSTIVTIELSEDGASRLVRAVRARDHALCVILEGAQPDREANNRGRSASSGKLAATICHQGKSEQPVTVSGIPEARRIEREHEEKLNSLVNVATLPSDPFNRMEEVRARIKEIRDRSVLASGREHREAIQKMTVELAKAERDFVTHEIERASKVAEYQHKAWFISFQAAWVEFLGKNRVELVANKQTFVIQWMEVCNSKRADIELRNLTPQQKKRLLDMIDKDEDEMIGEIEQMADKLVVMSKSELSREAGDTETESCP